MIKKLLVGLMSLMLTFMFMMPVSALDNGLDIGPELIEQPVRAAANPTVNKVSIGDKTVSGTTLGSGQRRARKLDVIIHVTVNRQAGGTEEKTLSILYTNRNSKWIVALDSELAEGDKVTVKQEYGGDISDGVILEVKKSLANQHKDKIKMPAGEIWIEETSANLVNEEEQKEAVDMFNAVNTEIAGDISSVFFSINGTDNAYYEITYTDGSKSGKIEAKNLKIKKVTEYSATPMVKDIKVTADTITGTLSSEVAEGTKIIFVKRIDSSDKNGYCREGSCSTNKSTIDHEAQVTISGTTFTIKTNNDNLQLGVEFGIVVKEPHKFRSCAKSEPVITTPDKVAVRDPHKLTDADKQAIDKAIRDANTVNGVSKLPDGTGYYKDIPAVIEFDKDGNVTIISPHNMVIKWNNGKPEYQKNDDGTYKVIDESKVTKFSAKDLVKNIKPDAPTVALSEDKKNITITPNEKDTDAKSISVSYTGSDNSNKTLEATKADDGTWSITKGEGSVDADGVVTLEVSKVKGGTKVTATVTDKGGIADDDKDALTSDQAEFKVTKAILVEALGGLDPVDIKKWVGDEIKEGFWKDGVKAKDSNNKAEVDKILGEEKTSFTDENSRGTTAEGDFTGKIKVKFDDDSFIEVDKQNLYVSNHVTSIERKDKVPTDAVDVEFKLGEGTKVDNTGAGAIEGNKDNPTSYSNYKVKPNTNLKDYKLPNLNASIIDSIKVTPQEGYTEPVWKDSKNGTNFVAAADNNVFTATATKTYKVTVVPNGGKGTEIKDTKKTGETYKLPAKDTFTPPDDNQEFAGWLVGDATTTTEPGKEITIEKDTVVKAIWKDIMVDINFKSGEGSGTMKKETVKKGSTFKLPPSKFEAPKNMEFKGWKIGDEEKAVGDEITVNVNTTVTAVWKKIPVKVTYDGNGGKGTMEGKSLFKGDTYKLLANGFTAPENQKFKAWEVDGKEVAAGTEITVTKDTVVKAIWQDIEVKVSYDANGGSGTMAGKTMKKGSTYKLLANGFTAPENQKFKAWEVDGKEVAAGTEITVDKDIVIKAIWQDKPSNASENPANNKDNPNGPKTGDSDMIYLYSIVLIMASGTIFAIGRKRSKEK